jgi:hypothetical protein
LSDLSCVKIYKRIYEHLRIDPDRAAIIFEESIQYGKTKIELLSEEQISNYRSWRISHFVSVDELISYYDVSMAMDEKQRLLNGILTSYSNYLCKKDRTTALQLFSGWFEKGKPLKEDFFKDLLLDIYAPAVEAEFQKHEAWWEKSQLRATPTILVNGYQLPENYKCRGLTVFY